VGLAQHPKETGRQGLGHAVLKDRGGRLQEGGRAEGCRPRAVPGEGSRGGVGKPGGVTPAVAS
jgi:hypothetical protein